MSAGLRVEDIRVLPGKYQDQVVDRIVAKVREKLPPMEEKEDPCIECLRWGECNGVDDACPFRT